MIRQLGIPFLLLMLILYIGVYSPELISSYGIKLSNQWITRIDYIFQCSVWLSAAWLLARFIVVFFWEGLLERKRGDKAHKLVKKIVTTIILFIAILGIISIIFKQPVTWIFATLGILSVFLGFALQHLLLDALTGIANDLDNPYKVGDWIIVHGNNPSENIEGCVIEINLRTTRIRTREDNLIVIPNRRLGQMMVTNYMKPELPSRQTLSFTLDINIPPERAIRTLLAGTKAVLGKGDLLEEPEPKVIISEMNASGIKYIVWFWMNGNLAPELGRNIVMISLVEHLQKAGISTAYPKQYIYHAPILTGRVEDSTADRTDLLSRIPLFTSLEKKELNQLSNQLKRRLYKEGQTVVKQGDEGKTMFIVAEGLLNIYTELEDSLHKVKVGQIIGGQFFGEMSMLTGQARSATAIAATDTVVYKISKDDITPLLNQNESFAETISQTISDRRLETLQKLANVAKEKRNTPNANISKQVLEQMRSYFEVK